MNYMKQVAQLLGVEIGEEFNLTIGGVTDVSCKFILTENGLACRCNGKQWYSNYLNQILYGSCKIVKIPKPVLDDVEKEYLSTVIKPFRHRIKHFYKYSCANGKYEVIAAVCTNHEYLDYLEFPAFKKGSMYKGMEVGKNYSLESLGL